MSSFQKARAVSQWNTEGDFHSLTDGELLRHLMILAKAPITWDDFLQAGLSVTWER